MNARMLIVAGVLTFSPFQPLLILTSYASSQGAISEVNSRIPTPAEREQDLKGFLDSRQFWFSIKPGSVDIRPSAESPNVFAVIMDWPIQSESNGVVQVLVGAVSDGTSSLYLSLGSRVLGGYSAKDQALSAISEAEKIFHYSESTTANPLPPLGEVYFYIRSYAGLFVMREKQSDLLNKRGKSWRLFGVMNIIMTIHLDAIDREMKPKLTLK